MSTSGFLDYLKFEKRYSPKTIESYQNDLKTFSDYCYFEAGLQNLSDVKKNDVRNFLMELSKSGLSDRSINRKISTLKSYYKYLIKIGEIEISPLAMISGLRHNNKVSLPFSEDEMQQLFVIDNIFENNYEGFRDRMIIELFYQTGIRRAELIGLKMADVDTEEKRIRVIGKRNKERLIPLGDEICENLKKFMVFRTETYPESDDFLFLTKKGQPLYDKFVYKLVNNYLSLVSTKTKKSPHVLRHSFATHLLNHGANLNEIKELLGHSSLAATQVYTHSGIEQLKEVFNIAHPRSSKN